jgi:hypothetical protein
MAAATVTAAATAAIPASAHALVVVLMLTVSHGLLFNNSCFAPAVTTPASPNL